MFFFEFNLELKTKSHFINLVLGFRQHSKLDDFLNVKIKRANVAMNMYCEWALRDVEKLMQLAPGCVEKPIKMSGYDVQARFSSNGVRFSNKAQRWC